MTTAHRRASLCVTIDGLGVEGDAVRSSIAFTAGWFLSITFAVVVAVAPAGAGAVAAGALVAEAVTEATAQNDGGCWVTTEAAGAFGIL